MARPPWLLNVRTLVANNSFSKWRKAFLWQKAFYRLQPRAYLPHNLALPTIAAKMHHRRSCTLPANSGRQFCLSPPLACHCRAFTHGRPSPTSAATHQSVFGLILIISAGGEEVWRSHAFPQASSRLPTPIGQLRLVSEIQPSSSNTKAPIPIPTGAVHLRSRDPPLNRSSSKGSAALRAARRHWGCSE